LSGRRPHTMGLICLIFDGSMRALHPLYALAIRVDWLLDGLGDAPFAFTPGTMSRKSPMLRASRSIHVTINASPLRSMSNTMRSSAQPSLVWQCRKMGCARHRRCRASPGRPNVERPFVRMVATQLCAAAHSFNLNACEGCGPQGLFSFAPPAQDYEIVGVGHDARAEASLQPEHLPSQNKPALGTL
jgi:hypothetical protein